MNLAKIAWRSIGQRPLTSLLTCVSMALGVALVVAVLSIYGVVEESFSRNRSLGYHLIIGGKNGSKLELVMSTVFHLGRPEVAIPFTTYKKFITSTDDAGKLVVGEWSENVERAVPICLGDNYQNFRVIATLPSIFDFEYARDRHYEFAQGRNFVSDKSGWFEAVIGAEVARQSGLQLGETFRPAHGGGEGARVHEDDFKVVGILAPSGTPNDRALFVHMEGFFRMEGHEPPKAENAAGKPKPTGEAAQAAKTEKPSPTSIVLTDEQKQVTAILVRYGSEFYRQTMPDQASAMADAIAADAVRKIDRSSDAQAASPSVFVTELLERFVSPTKRVLLALTILTVVIASVGIMVGIYNTMLGRRHEIAVMRALGARRTTVMAIVMIESILLSLIGGLIGLALGQLMVAAAGPWLIEYTGVALPWWHFDYRTAAVVPGLVALSALVGYLPAQEAYRTDVVAGLAAPG